MEPSGNIIGCSGSNKTFSGPSFSVIFAMLCNSFENSFHSFALPNKRGSARLPICIAFHHEISLGTSCISAITFKIVLYSVKAKGIDVIYYDLQPLFSFHLVLVYTDSNCFLADFLEAQVICTFF